MLAHTLLVLLLLLLLKIVFLFIWSLYQSDRVQFALLFTPGWCKKPPIHGFPKSICMKGNAVNLNLKLLCSFHLSPTVTVLLSTHTHTHAHINIHLYMHTYQDGLKCVLKNITWFFFSFDWFIWLYPYGYVIFCI